MRLNDADPASQPYTDATILPSGRQEQPPPAPPLAPDATPASGLPFGSAVWLAFVFGLATAISWWLVELTLAVARSLPFELAQGSPPLLPYALADAAMQLAVPIIVIVVAWRQRRGALGASGPASFASFVGALVALATITFGPTLFVLALAGSPQTTPLASALATKINPLGGLEIIRELPLLSVVGASHSLGSVVLAAVYVWGATAPGRGLRWLAPARWALLGLSAAVGFTLFGVVYDFLHNYIYTPPANDAVRGAFTLATYWFPLSYDIVITLVAAALGGALAWLGARASRADNGAATPTPLTPGSRAPRRWGRAVGVGAAAIALGVASALWAPVILLINLLLQFPVVTGFVSLVSAALLAPLAIIAWAFLAIRRRFGGASAWRVVGVAALGATPVLVGVLANVITGTLSSAVVFFMFVAGAPAGFMFSVGVGVGAIFGGADRVRWHGRASALGALAGVGYALVFYAVAFDGIIGRFVTSCSGFVGCVVAAALLYGQEQYLLDFCVYGFGLALAGGLVGGWLRALAVSRAAPPRTTGPQTRDSSII